MIKKLTIQGSKQGKSYLEVLNKPLASIQFDLKVEETINDEITENTWMVTNQMGTMGKAHKLALSESKVKFDFEQM